MRNSEEGRRVVCESVVQRNGKPHVLVTGCFLFRGAFKDFGGTFAVTKKARPAQHTKKRAPPCASLALLTPRVKPGPLHRRGKSSLRAAC